MMSKTKPALFAAALLAIAGALVALLVGLGAGGDGALPSATERTVDVRFRWPAGTRYVYELAWSGAQRTTIAGASFDGTLRLDGRLTVRSFGDADGATLLGLSFTRLDRVEIGHAGQALTADADAVRAGLVGSGSREALLEVEPTGRVRNVRFAPETPALAQQLLLGLIGETEVLLPEAPAIEWKRPARTMVGRALGAWRGVTGTLTVSRRLLGYDQITLVPASATSNGTAPIAHPHATLTARLDRAGHLAELASHETTRITTPGDGGGDRAELGHSDEDLKLRLVEVGQFDASARPELAGLVRRDLGEILQDADSEQRMLELRAAGMTAEQVLDDLAQSAAGGIMADHDTWLWRAVAVLRLHPEACADLVPLFQDPRTGDKGRALILDLLAAAGHHAAQAALREALASDAARTDPAYGLLLQRASLLGAPDAETAAMMKDVFANARGPAARETRLSAAYSLGSIAGKVDPATGEALAGELHRAIRATGDPDERGALLGALGNSKRESDLAYVATFAHDDSPRVRSDAMLALGSRATDYADLLLAALMDRSMDVKASALQTLAEAQLDAARRLRLAELVENGTVPIPLHALVLEVVTRHLERTPEVIAVLEAVAAYGERGDPRIVERASTLIAQLGAAS